MDTFVREIQNAFVLLSISATSSNILKELDQVRRNSVVKYQSYVGEIDASSEGSGGHNNNKCFFKKSSHPILSFLLSNFGVENCYFVRMNTGTVVAHTL